jgi:hypothetical protein
MAMFDLKDSEDIKLTDCHTDAKTLVKGEGLKRLEVDKSSASASVRPKFNLMQFFLNHLLATCLSVLATVVGGYFIFWFGWTG